MSHLESSFDRHSRAASARLCGRRSIIYLDFKILSKPRESYAWQFVKTQPEANCCAAAI